MAQYQSNYTGTEIDDAVAKRHTHENKAILDDITASYTAEDKTKLDGIEVNAQVNVIETVKVNGTALIPSSKSVNVTVPTKTSDITNDSGFVDNTYHDNTKQDTLVSGTNIKTINGNNILGSGNIEVRRWWRHVGKYHRYNKRSN